MEESSSESDEKLVLESDDESVDLESSDEDNADDNTPSIPLLLTKDSFIIAKVYSGVATTFKNFIAKVISGPDDDIDYEISFLKRSRKVKNSFVFPDNPDFASISIQDVACVLPPPSSVANTARLANVLRFSGDIVNYDVV